jgi:Rod binding domain-containing protein
MDSLTPISPLQTDFALQKAKLDALQRGTDSASKTELSEEKKAGYARAARGFESMFVHEMYKAMRQAMLDDDDKDDDDGMTFGDETLQGFADLQFSDYVSQSGRGMGIAQMMYKNLSGEDSLPPIIAQTIHEQVNRNSSVPETATALKPMQTQPGAVKPLEAFDGSFLSRMQNRLEPFNEFISGASEKYGVPTSLIKAIITAESAANPTAVSSAGAKGLMQLMNGTARDLNVDNPFDPEQNIFGGTEYIGRMLKTFGSLDNAIAAYNAGPGAVQKHGGIPPYNETQNYVRRVRRFLSLYSNQDGSSDL